VVVGISFQNQEYENIDLLSLSIFIFIFMYIYMTVISKPFVKFFCRYQWSEKNQQTIKHVNIHKLSHRTRDLAFW